MKEDKLEQKKQTILAMKNHGVKIWKLKKLIDDINRIQIIDILDSCNNEPLLNIMSKYYADEFKDFSLIYSKLKSLKFKKELTKTFCESFNNETAVSLVSED